MIDDDELCRDIDNSFMDLARMCCEKGSIDAIFVTVGTADGDDGDMDEIDEDDMEALDWNLGDALSWYTFSSARSNVVGWSLGMVSVGS